MGVREIGADLRKVGPVQRAGMVVDAERAVLNDLGHQQIGQPCCHRPRVAPRKTSIQIPPIGQITVLGHETVDVDHRNRNERPPKLRRLDPIHHVEDQVDPVDLVTVNGRVEKDCRSIGFPSDHDHRQRQQGPRRQPRHRNLDPAPRAFRNLFAVDDHR